jgi:hypothetical protein
MRRLAALARFLLQPSKDPGDRTISFQESRGAAAVACAIHDGIPKALAGGRHLAYGLIATRAPARR